MKRIIYTLVFIFTFLIGSELQSQTVNNGKYPADGKYTLIMSLSKFTYKEYEPIMAKFELINNDKSSVSVSFHEIFNEFTDWSGKFSITDDSGNTWSERVLGCDCIFLKEPKYEIKPNDTLVISLPINNFGRKINSYYYFFGEGGYFPAGKKYKAFYYSNNFDINLRSNDVEFEVTDLNKEDSSIIKDNIRIYGEITRDSAFSLIIHDYPVNTLTEYMYKEHFMTELSKFRKDENNYDETHLLNEYSSFLNKYPDSYYIYDDYFMIPLFTLLYSTEKSKNGVIDIIQKSFQNKNLMNFLNNHNFKKRMEFLIKK